MKILNRARFINGARTYMRAPGETPGTFTLESAIDVHFIGKPDPHISSIGARGIGEIGITGAAAAIANAVFNATGKRIRDLPLTPDKLI